MPPASPSTVHPTRWQGFAAIATRFMRDKAHEMIDRRSGIRGSVRLRFHTPIVDRDGASPVIIVEVGAWM
jgi:hypothetical protein